MHLNLIRNDRERISMPLMQCGCRAQGINMGTGKPCCIVHHGCPEAELEAPEPDLTKRTAKCSYCSTREPSSLDLPFFVHQPNKPEDDYYCGCRGWD